MFYRLDLKMKNFSTNAVALIPKLTGIVLTLLLVAHWLVFQSHVALAQRELEEIPQANPGAEVAAMAMFEGAAANLFASDPKIRKPIQINFDSKGQLWVASSQVYPHIKPSDTANDKIIVLRDQDGDGTCDSSTVFADGLLIPTGVAPDENGGAYVAASTELLHFTDTNGDGKSDSKRVVLSGFGTEDTHHLIHTLRWGPDGCLYFNQSIYIHSHIETAFGTKHLDGGGIWRYNPETGDLSVFAKGLVNPWGHAFDAYGESFATDGAGSEGINYIFPNAVYAASPGEVRWLPGLNPGSPKHCGLEVISGSHFPASWWGSLVTNDFRGHRVCRFTIQPSGSSYISRQQPEIVKSSHIAFRPVDVRIGPDGALYIADWYNPIIQHGEVDFRDRRRDREHGRIWRIYMKGRQLDGLPDFSNATVSDLLGLLESPSLPVRQFSRQHLWKRLSGDKAVVMNAASEWRLKATTADSLSKRALEVQWLGEVGGLFVAEVVEHIRMSVPSASSRPSLRSAIRTGGIKQPVVDAWIKDVLQGKHNPTILESIVGLGKEVEGDAALESSEMLIKHAQNQSTEPIDPSIDFALWQSLRKTSHSWVKALGLGELKWKPNDSGLAYAITAASSESAANAVFPLLSDAQIGASLRQSLVAAISVSGDPNTLGRLLELGFRNPKLGQHIKDAYWLDEMILENLVERYFKDRTVPSNGGKLLAEKFPDLELLPEGPRLRNLLLKAFGVWQHPVLARHLIDLSNSINTSEESLSGIVDSLGFYESQDAKKELLRWCENGVRVKKPIIAVKAATALAINNPKDSAREAANLLNSLESDSLATQLINSLQSNQKVVDSLINILPSNSLGRERARALISALRNSGGNERLESAIFSSGRLDKTGWEPSPNLNEEILKRAKSTGDPVKGEKIYRRQSLQCISCHAIGTGGGVVGPNLISLGSSSQPDYILESLWLPNHRVKEGYNSVSILINDGKLLSGIPIGRDDENLRVRLANGNELAIPIETIDDEQPGQSLMPKGLVDSLTKEELIDLVAFLSALGRLSSFTVSTDPVVRSFETLVVSQDAIRRLNRTSIDSVASEHDNATFRWRLITTKVDGTLPLEELEVFKQNDASPTLSFIRFNFDIPLAVQTTKIGMNSEIAYLWVDGKPIPPENLYAIEFSSGLHQIVIGVNPLNFKSNFSVSVQTQ